MKRLLLIGTNHTYQYGAGNQWLKGSPCEPEDEQAFRMKLTAVAVEHRVGCIAEEMNEEGLADAKQSKSVPQIVAGSLGLPHIFCEASRKKRADLGVREEAEIRCWGNLYEKSDAEIDAQVKESFRRREAYWLERVEALGTWPVLFICGAKHVVSFPALLCENGVECEVLHASWKP